MSDPTKPPYKESHAHISDVIKPPIGLVPKWVRDKERFDEICAALSRYYNAGKKIPIEWVEEYNSLVEVV